MARQQVKMAPPVGGVKLYYQVDDVSRRRPPGVQLGVARIPERWLTGLRGYALVTPLVRRRVDSGG